MNYSFENNLSELSLSSLITTLKNTNNFYISQSKTNTTASVKESKSNSLNTMLNEPYINQSKSKLSHYNQGKVASERRNF